jgi:hypothetical protein
MTHRPLNPANTSSTAAANGSPEAFIAAGAAATAVGIEAFRQVRFEDLPAEVIAQLRRDGTRGDLRDLDGARDVYWQNVPAEARGSMEGVETITNDPAIDWMHKVPHDDGGSRAASNGVYGPEELNGAIGDRPMTEAEIAEAKASFLEIAEQATPGVTGDLAEVAGDTLDTGVLGVVMGFRDTGREDLAAAAEAQMMEDAARGAVNGVVRGTTVAVTQAVLGANPLTPGIGLVAPDVVSLLREKERLSEADVQRRRCRSQAREHWPRCWCVQGRWAGWAWPGSPWPRPTRRPTVMAARVRRRQALPAE